MQKLFLGTGEAEFKINLKNLIPKKNNFIISLTANGSAVRYIPKN